jgi:putative membrane protein
MMSYPILLAVQRLSSTALGVAVLGSWLLFSWDLFLDPQMVGEGYWTWSNVDWTLPGIDNIPLQNFLGWLLSGFVLMWLLDRLPRKSAKDGVPILMLSWMFVSNVLANAVFFERPAVAIWGGFAMAIVVLPWWWRLWTQPQW